MPRDYDKTLELVRAARNGNNEAFDKLLKELEPDLRKIAGRYFISGSEKEDVVQEGRIGVYKAVMDFDENGGMSFRNFAINLCCRRHVITAMAAANRKKYDLHNNAMSLDEPIYMGDEEAQVLADFIQDPESDMVDDIIMRDECDTNSERLVGRLTSLEANIFETYKHLGSYKEIADVLNIKTKAVDNSLMRVRHKAKEIYDDYIASEGVINWPEADQETHDI